MLHYLFTQESSGTQEKKLDDVQRRMVTATRVQVCVMYELVLLKMCYT